MSNESHVQVNNGQVTAYVGRDATHLLRLRMILTGLRVEASGMRLTRKGPSCLTICKKQMGLKGSRDQIIEQVKALIVQAQANIEVRGN
jgi:hypothetical protein